MPRLIELTLTKAEITKGFEENFVTTFLSQMVPNKFGNRFAKYSLEQTELIVRSLKVIHSVYFMEDYEYWDNDLELLVENEDFKKNVQYCEKALIFWESKRNQWAIEAE